MRHRKDRQPGLVERCAPVPDDFAGALRALYATATTRGSGRGRRGPADTPGDRTLNATLAEARRKGWRLESLAEPLGIVREAVRLRVLKARPDVEPLPVPEPPRNPEPAPRPLPPSVPPGLAAELRGMYAVARTVNGGTLSTDPARRVSEELSARLAKLRAEGMPWLALDAAIGARPGTVRVRLARHRLIHAAPSIEPYQGRSTWEPREDVA